MFGLASDQSRWLLVYFPVSWITQFGHGLVTNVVGPTQPYLAINVNVDIDTINFVWTFGFLGYLIGSLATGFIFKRFIRSSTSKLVWLCVTIMLTGVFMIILPLTSSFAVLVTARLVQNLAVGAFLTADSSLVVYLLGPTKSRPFTMALHALIGAGFLASTFLVRPFLPAEDEVDKNIICQWSNLTVFNETTNVVTSVTETEVQYLLTNKTVVPHDQLIPTLAWPFIISGGWCIVFSVGFLILACLPYKMPCFYEERDTTKEQAGEKNAAGIKYKCTLLVLVFFYYFTSCGIERIFQPMATTFGLCTKTLDLSPSDAVITDSCYNGGFMCGRIVSAFIASFVKPRNMILASLVFCIGAASILVALADTEVYALYIGTAILGFFISWQFGSCFSWVANKMNITGGISSIFFIGCGAGSLVVPPVVGFTFTSSLGTMSIMYLTLIFCFVQCILFFCMWMVARVRIRPPIYQAVKLSMQ